LSADSAASTKGHRGAPFHDHDEDAKRGLADIAAGRAFEAVRALADLQRRRAGAKATVRKKPG
jgi:hypothetical protein